MSISMVTALIRVDTLETVEARLRSLGVRGLTVTLVRGFGERENFFRRDHKVSHIRLEVFAETQRAREIVETIVETAHTGACGDGVVAILPVDEVVRIRSKRKASDAELA